MTAPAQRAFRLGAALLLAALIQLAFSDSLTIRGARPDILLATALLSAMFCGANGGAALGFTAGLVYTCFAAPPNGGFGSLVFSRTLVCLGVGWLEERIYRDSGLLAVAIVTLGTVLAEGIFFIADPQGHLLHWARSVLSTTLYNFVLAYPLYLLLRRWLGSLRERDAN